MKKFKLYTILIFTIICMIGCESPSKEESKDDDIESQVESTLKLDEINLTMINPQTINPILNKDKSVNNVLELVYDSLFTIDENYNVVEELVKSYEIYDAGLSLDIQLKDAKWHNDKNVSSQDVAYTVNLIKNNESSPYFGLIQNIKDVIVKDSNSLTITFKNKYAFSKETLIFPIVSQKQLSNSNNELDSKVNLIGNGPYKITNYKERKNLILEVNENYYGEINKNAKDINVSLVPDKESQVSMVNALKSDISEILPSDLSKFNEKQFDILSFEGRQYESIVFNYKNELFKDINFRKAIASVIDKELIVSEAYVNEATSVNFPINTKSEYNSKDIKTIDYNLEEAKKYLQKVDIKNIEKEDIEDDEVEKTDEEKIKELEKGGNDLQKVIQNSNLKIIVNRDNIERVKSAHLIASKLQEIGLKATIIELNSEEIELALEKKEYDLAMIGWELSNVPNIQGIVEQSGYSDDKLTDTLVNLNNLVSTKEIMQKHKEVQAYINDKVPFISLVIKNDYIVKNNRLEGDLNPNSFKIYNNIQNLTI